MTSPLLARPFPVLLLLLLLGSLGCGEGQAPASGASGAPAAAGVGGGAAGNSTGGALLGGNGGATTVGGTGGSSSLGGESMSGSGAGSGSGGVAGGAALPLGSCEFTVSKNEISSKLATVGVVEWTVAGEPPARAKLVYKLKDAPATVLNTGGEAPVDLNKPAFRTLLLGLKQSKDYTFHIEATRSADRCVSPDYTLPKTGTLAATPTVSVSVEAADKRDAGFILAGSGIGGNGAGAAFIIDADGEIVWYAPAPASTTRVQMDYEGENVWMLSNNVQNSGGEMRYLSMDGQQGQNNVTGLAAAHHDFTVMPGGKVAAMVWSGTGRDPDSDLVIRAPDGSLTTPFKIGANLYVSSTFHCNAIHYLLEDDSFTISDRNPNMILKVSSAGVVQWQLGGSCANAPAGNKCSAQSWKINHGHHLLSDGTFVLFNNGSSGNSHVFEFKLSASASAFDAMLVKDYTGTASSGVLGDVQRLPNGNTLITYSSANKIIEVDPTWNVVQTFSGIGGYASFRTTLYGPPLRP